MKKILIIGGTILVVGYVLHGYFSWLIVPQYAVWKADRQAKKTQEIQNAQQFIQEEPQQYMEEAGLHVVRYTIAEGDIPATVLSDYGNMDFTATQSLIEAGTDIFDYTHVGIGHEMRFFFDEESDTLSRIEYDRNNETMIVASVDEGQFFVYEEEIPYETEDFFVTDTIEDFLYVDALDAGLSERTVISLGDIFSFDVDFTTEIKVGDEYAVAYQKRWRDGEEAPDGNILAAKYVNDGSPYYAYYFHDGDTIGYFDAEGRELKKQFLRAPLSYRRISSGYTGARFHPITKTVSAHHQIDYAAASGTPVVATADGSIASVGWEGGWGRMVRLRHDNGYTTHYAHLSGFADGITEGEQVEQGQLVGFVGSTGWSTGPHLDYGMRHKGSPVNPMALKLPKGDSLPDDKMKIFEEVKEEYRELLQ